MYFKVFLFTLLFFNLCSAQINNVSGTNQDENKKTNTLPTGTYDQYRIITLQRDTTYVDTSLTIKKEYEYNYLRKDNFGLLAFANEGQTYTRLDYGLLQQNAFPALGFSGKHFNYLEVNDINYYSVATPITELYFKTVMEQGQSLDAMVAVNTSEQFNISFAYKGLRSLGKYINQLSSTGNFRVTSNYHTKNNRYLLNFHYTGQDFLNGENGGILSTADFESENVEFQNRARLQVYLNDAKSKLIGKRLFFDHSFRINTKSAANNLFITHQFNYEYKSFAFQQQTVQSTVNNLNFNRFGTAFVTSNINDTSRYFKFYNKIGAVYENKFLGKFQFFLEDFQYSKFYNRIIINEAQLIPNKFSDQINTFGGQYEYRKNKWNGNFLFSRAITNQSLNSIEAKMHYKYNEKNQFIFQYQNLNKIPDVIYNFHQSSYLNYNWLNNFKNEKINKLEATANTQWLNAAIEITALQDHLYFSNDDTANLQIITPKQYEKSINYFSAKVSRELKWWKLALDNTILYQKVVQDDPILNVPEITTRNTLYFSDYFFKKAMYLQTGFIFNYFTQFYANDFNPVIAEGFVQNQTQIGNFPMIDFFINARIRQTRIFLKAEHFNSGFTGNKFYSAPNYPYRDFIVRFGLVWNFFQ
jgi:hypothetical protein